MSDPTPWIAFFIAIIPAIATAVLQIRAGWRQDATEKRMTAQANVFEAKLDANSKETSATASAVAKVEEQTNSMKDALVASTAKASTLEGHAAGVKDAVALSTAAADALVDSALTTRLTLIEETLKRMEKKETS